MTDSPVLYKRIESMLIASIKTRIDSRDQIPPLLESVRMTCGNAAIHEDDENNLPMVIIHGGAVKDGMLVEAAYPVSRPIEAGDVHTRMLAAASVWTMLHHGSHQTLRETTLKIYHYLSDHAWTGSNERREIYQVLDPAQPENNVIEVQLVIHEWDRLFAEAAEREFSLPDRQLLMEGIEVITPETSASHYTDRIRNAIERLDQLTTDSDQKCRVVSHCAHVFPPERIDHLREIYQRGDLDDILHEMYTDHFWYEKPVRRGNVIYMRKNPFDQEAYQNAATPGEKRKAYCHCSFVRPYLDETPSRLSPTFCYCGAGWYRQLWEGILGLPVKIEHVETLLRGNDQCTLTITLPVELSGECYSEDTFEAA